MASHRGAIPDRRSTGDVVPADGKREAFGSDHAIANPLIGGRSGAAAQSDQDLRLNKTERRGQYFESPVARFFGTTGAANTGPQLTFRVLFTKGVESVQLLRNVSKDPGSAKMLQSYAMAPEATGLTQVNRDLSYHDSDPATFGKTLFYFLKVVPLHRNFQPIVHGPVAVAVP